jgi:hypothetical protein
MRVTLDLPEELLEFLGNDANVLSAAAREALVLEGVRSRKLSTFQARRILGMESRFQIESFLKEHGIDLPLSFDQVRKDSDTALSLSE